MHLLPWIRTAVVFCVFFSMNLSAELSRSQETSQVDEKVERDAFAKSDLGFRPIYLSLTMTQVLDVNAHGDVVGLYETAPDKNFYLTQVNYFQSADGTLSQIEPFEGYTNVEMTAISNTGTAAGYVSRPLGTPGGTISAATWTKADKTQLLPHLPDDRGSQAKSISDDGTVIAGYSVGEQRLRPCVWHWDADAEQWRVELLESVVPFNPNLMLGGVAISPNGLKVAVCLVENVSDIGVMTFGLYQFHNHENEWIRKRISQQSMRVKAIANDGTTVGSFKREGPESFQSPCVISIDGERTEIPLLEGDVSGEAMGIDANGIVYGFSDDPHGPDGGPQAFRWDGQQTTKLTEFGEEAFGMVMGVDTSGKIGGLIELDAGFLPEQIKDLVVQSVGFVLDTQPRAK